MRNGEKEWAGEEREVNKENGPLLVRVGEVEQKWQD